MTGQVGGQGDQLPAGRPHLAVQDLLHHRDGLGPVGDQAGPAEVAGDDPGGGGGEEGFYQLGLSEFGNFGTIQIPEGLSIRDLLELSMETEDSDGMMEQFLVDEIEASHLLQSNYRQPWTF